MLLLAATGRVAVSDGGNGASPLQTASVAMRSPDSIAIPFALAKPFALIFAFAANVAVSDLHLAGLAITQAPHSSTGFRRGGRGPNARRCADHE